MIMNDDGGTFHGACCFLGKEGLALTEWLLLIICGFDAASLPMAGGDLA